MNKQETSCLASRTSDNKTETRAPDHVLNMVLLPYSLALAAFWRANQKSDDIYLAPCPHSQQHAEGSNKEQTIVPHLYVLIHFLKWVKGEDWCLTPSSADTKYTSCVRQTKNSITDYFFNDFWHINPNLSRHNRCNMRLSFCGNKIFCIGYSWASRRSRGKLRSSV